MHIHTSRHYLIDTVQKIRTVVINVDNWNMNEAKVVQGTLLCNVKHQLRKEDI